ncbi:MAG: hypothetical protein RR704_00755 [Stenotrophomonas sp.]
MNMTPSFGLGALSFSAAIEVPKIAKKARPLVQHNLAGYGYMRTVMEFMKWAHEQDKFPTIQAVQDRFGFSRATAYRLTSALADTYGIDPALRHKEPR